MSRVKAYRPAPMPASVMDLAEVFPVFAELWAQEMERKLRDQLDAQHGQAITELRSKPSHEQVRRLYRALYYAELGNAHGLAGLIWDEIRETEARLADEMWRHFRGRGALDSEELRRVFARVDEALGARK